MKPRESRALDGWVSKMLVVLGLGLVGLALSKPLLLVAGSRAKGVIVFQEGGVSTRGAYSVRYRFTVPDGQTYEGTAFTAVQGVRFARVTIAYLAIAPHLNMPASGGYALVTGVGWGLAGLLALVIAKSLGKPRRQS